MNTIIHTVPLGPMIALYTADEAGHVGFSLIPQDQKEHICEKNYHPEPLVQLHIRGDHLGGAYMNGHSMSGSETTMSFTYVSQERTEDQIITLLEDPRGRRVKHIVEYHKDWEALVVYSEFLNTGTESVCLELLSSFCLGGITPFEPDDAPETLVRHYIKSDWSAEGRLISDPIERLNLEPSWSNHGVRIEKIGQVGSLPVRGYFPFAAVEDTKNHVTWAAQLCCSATWQIELKRKDAALVMIGGLGDYNFGHWAKEIAPGQSFTSPEAIITTVSGTVDDACQSLLTVQKSRNTLQEDSLPLLFNEYCTTWGVPSDANLSAILDVLKDRGFDYLVMDCGWFIDGVHGWYETNGDWEVSPDLFPHGLDTVVEKIHAAGIKAGIWFEPETCGPFSRISHQTDWLLKRDGHVINVSGKTFLDLRKPEVQQYLEEKVIGLLQQYHFDYIKIDYNDSIGMGCDGAESLGEGLRQNMEGSAAFFQKLHETLPHLTIENCASGGHRLSPYMMRLSSMASFSDAHECLEIPIIAANLHRVILPGQSQIWAVIRADDSLQRITYSLTAAMLGVMCLSGDIHNLGEAQWQQIDKGTRFYKKIAPILRDGRSEIITSGIKSYRHPQGWQAVKRISDARDEVLLVVHGFANPKPLNITLDMDSSFAISDIYTHDGVQIVQEDGCLHIQMPEDFSGAAVWLTKKKYI